MFVSAMLTEVPDKPPYSDPTGTKQVRDFAHLSGTLINTTSVFILDYWKDNFLSTSASASVLTEGLNGWLSPEARKVIEDDTNLDPENWHNFEEFFGHSKDDGKALGL
ncbi:hypothetical protein BDV29DRAFT_23287 [Aspergillus leporis]|uniref:L-tryptophan decarboxylase PsiD-like domain-containing protein n=1 Tax=Aspergillus leporis TaxID=41062 RepID=A0A5N5WRA9_9EURO|nr:hypothetical protein BDV29DRAFT_23287 [Aspergillus leporis]